VIFTAGQQRRGADICRERDPEEAQVLEPPPPRKPHRRRREPSRDAHDDATGDGEHEQRRKGHGQNHGDHEPRARASLPSLIFLSSLYFPYLTRQAGRCYWQISLVMDKFEAQFSDSDVQTSFMEDGMGSTTAVSMPQDQVDSLMRQMAEEADIEL
jgi:hypothetical protein